MGKNVREDNSKLSSQFYVCTAKHQDYWECSAWCLLEL